MIIFVAVYRKKISLCFFDKQQADSIISLFFYDNNNITKATPHCLSQSDFANAKNLCYESTSLLLLIVRLQIYRFI
jgi:hypothetical protein